MSISLDQVTKRYQSQAVVNDVSLEIAEGEFLVLLGPSGSGKSTLLRAIAGLTEIDHGRISLYGRDVTHVSARQREVGFVFQHYALFKHMSVADNIEFALRVRRVRAAERVARRKELLRLVALEGMDERLPAELSGGQQQRVAVARALAHRPKVLLMDEPFGALDAKIREELRRTVRQIQREIGMTTILVTHDQEEAFALADRIGVMNQGRLLECGGPDDLYARPASRFVATFLGAANLLLGYRDRSEVRFTPPELRGESGAHAAVQEVVSVLRPEEVELAADEDSVRSTYVGRARVEEVLFAGAVERLRVRMTDGGTVPAGVALARQNEVGTLLEVTRTLPEQRGLPVRPGQQVAVGARRIHVLPTPISSFCVVAASDAERAEVLGSSLLDSLAVRMNTRVTARTEPALDAPLSACEPTTRALPGLVVVQSGDGGAARVAWLLHNGASQILCLPSGSTPSRRVAIMCFGDDARSRTLAVAASLLRNLPAEAVFLSINPASLPESERGACLRRLLDARSEASARHGLDLRTELKFGELENEVAGELGNDGSGMLVVGVPQGSVQETMHILKPLEKWLEAGTRSPVLIVCALGAESGVLQ